MTRPLNVARTVALSSRPFVPQGATQQGRLTPTIPPPAADSRDGACGDDRPRMPRVHRDFWPAYGLTTIAVSTLFVVSLVVWVARHFGWLA